ncbi:hypothetical protein MPSEU_000221200 [Mayamaea pseudoterrestris]|nr:hypothetical protein MPSEU_000221200 [Mayamaea pseudoterrestris]
MKHTAGSFLLYLLSCTSMTSALVATSASMSTPAAPPSSRHQLYDMPVSNNGARCRIIIYKKNLPVDIIPPSQLGGLKSEEYLQTHPQGKMPALSGPDGIKLGESDTIARYLLASFADQGPSFQPDNPQSNMLARIHDVYMAPIQSCMYRLPPPFGLYGTRSDALDEYVHQCHILESLMSSDGLYLCGDQVSLADATIFPSCVFAHHMLPKFDRRLPPKLQAWFDAIREQDDVFAKVYEEMNNALQTWEANDRWAPLLGAGWRDNEPTTLFDKILSGDISAEVVHEDDKVLAFNDINPAGPAHVLVIPKVRAGLTRLSKATAEHVEILGRLLVAASDIVKKKELGFGDGARIVINDGPDGGQEINHLHVHVIGGRKMSWPPG